MKVESVKYVIWAADPKRAVRFYRQVFGGEVLKESEVISEVSVCGATIGIHGGGEGKRTWTGLSFQVADVIAGAAGGCSGRRPANPRTSTRRRRTAPPGNVRGHRRQRIYADSQTRRIENKTEDFRTARPQKDRKGRKAALFKIFTEGEAKV